MGLEDWLSVIRAKLRDARNGLSLRAAEVKTGVPFTTIDRVEKGKTVPSLDVLYRLAEGYGVPIAEIVCSPLPAPEPPAPEPGKRGGAKGKGKRG